MIGSKAYRKTVTITVDTPKPNPSIKIESIARDGMVWITFAKPITQSLIFRFFAMKIPMGIPTIAAKMTP